MAEVKLTGENFEEEVIKCDKTVLVDFWAEWCGPCKMLAPILSEFAEKHPEIKVGKVNVDECVPLTLEYGISSIPSLILFKDGKKVKMTVGLQSESDLEEFIK